MKAKWIAAVAGIVIVVALVVGFGGYSLGVKAGQAQALAARTRFFADRGVGTGGQGFGGGQGGGQFNADNFASGQVKQIDGNTIQLSTAQNVLTVKLTDKTQIQKMGPGTATDIQPGERITIQGSKGSDGVFTAQMIQIGGGRFGGGGPPPTPAPNASAN
jgi:hypothetical protein